MSRPASVPTHVVTGTTSGIGAEVAYRLRARGDRVVEVTRDAVDLADSNAVAEWHLDSDRVDSLVHCAGVVELGPVAEAEPDAWQRTLAVNLVAPALLTRALLPHLRHAGGTVVFVNSGSGLRANPAWASYAASKFGLRALADALRLEEPAIRVTSVFPGRTATRMQEQVHAQEGKEYNASQWIQPGTVAEEIIRAIDLPGDATVPEIVIRPRG